MTLVVRNMFFPIMGMLGDIESIEINRISRIVEFDLDLAFCSATLTVKDWDTHEVLAIMSSSLTHPKKLSLTNFRSSVSSKIYAHLL